MSRIRVIKPFRFSPDGVQVVDYEPGVCDVTERCAEVALGEGWAEEAAAGADTSASSAPPAAPAKRGRKPAARTPGV